MSTKETLRPTFPTLDNPPYPRLTYGVPFYEACAKHVKETFRAEKPYIIASNTLSKKTNFLAQLQDALSPNIVGIWIGIPNHTPIDDLVPIIKDMKAKEADCLITLGGGSISDGAKLISFALPNNATSIEDILQLPRIRNDGSFPEEYGNSKPPSIPVICIPILLSGGEYSCFAGVTESKTNMKYQFTHDKLYPSLVILDGKLVQSTPTHVWLASGVRSIDHCIEGFLSLNVMDQGDEAALKALPMLVEGLLRVKKGASRGIGHQLGPLGVAHGETSCILLPAVCKYNAVVNGEKQKVLKDLLCGLDVVKIVLSDAGVDVDKADLGDVLRAIFDNLGMPKSLRDVGVGPEKLDALAQNCMKETFAISNPRPMRSKEDVLEVLHMVLE